MSLPTAHKCLHEAYACVLSHERYKGRWHSMKTLQAMGNAQWIDAKCQEIDDGIAFLESQEKGIMADIMAEMCREHKSSRVADDEKLTTFY